MTAGTACTEEEPAVAAAAADFTGQAIAAGAAGAEEEAAVAAVASVQAVTAAAEQDAGVAAVARGTRATFLGVESVTDQPATTADRPKDVETVDSDGGGECGGRERTADQRVVVVEEPQVRAGAQR
ncbi:hypothetical protein CRM90_23610 [Mycobacterium sp. ENV421]|nr:hypothetical protein CRM90_23610 [Mycobacterium sp. ENV421]